MRVKALQFVFISTLALGAHRSLASSTKPVARKADAIPQAHSKAKPVDREQRVVDTNGAPGKATKRVEVAHSRAVAKPRRAEPKVIASREKAAPFPRRAGPVPATERIQPQDSQDSIQVTHDRKQHFSSGGATGIPESRKATPADFLSPFAMHRASPWPPASPVEAKPGTPKVNRQDVPAAMTPALFTRRGRLIVPPAMKGSHEILLHQNEMADRDGLDRVRDDADLDQMRDDKLLVAIPAGPGLVQDERLPMNRRYCRPWTAQFLTAMSRAFFARFHTSLQVNSAVRTVEFQQRLLMTNGNAAPAEGETASPHLTGQAVDLAKHGLSMTQIAWVRGYLLPLVQAGKVDVEEEFQQACFHISVYRKYVPEPAPRREIAGTHAGAGAILATAIR